MPADIKRKWEPWILECVEFMLDGAGTFRRFRYDLPLDEQPRIDLLIYRIVRAKYMSLMRAKQKGSDG